MLKVANEHGITVGTVRILMPKQAGICLVASPAYKMTPGGFVEFHENDHDFVGRILTVSHISNEEEDKLQQLIRSYGREPLLATATYKPEWQTEEVDSCDFCPA